MRSNVENDRNKGLANNKCCNFAIFLSEMRFEKDSYRFIVCRVSMFIAGICKRGQHEVSYQNSLRKIENKGVFRDKLQRLHKTTVTINIQKLYYAIDCRTCFVLHDL